jgi:hypothetical protein
MLDDHEWQAIRNLRAPKPWNRVADAFAPMLDAYERITGQKESNPNAIGHHRVSLYGPPCKSCGKPLRSPLALNADNRKRFRVSSMRPRFTIRDLPHCKADRV